MKITENCQDLLKKIGFCTPQIVLNPSNKKKFFELPDNIYKTEKAEQQYSSLDIRAVARAKFFKN